MRGNVSQIDFCVVDARGSNLAEVLHQQEINLVANRVRFCLSWPENADQAQQAFLSDQRIGLQELAQLVDLNLAVHLFEPLPGLLHGFFAGSLDAGLKLGAGLDVDGELAREFKVNGIKAAGRNPLRCQVLHRCGRGHDFTIQLGTSRLKRAATRVFPG